MTVKKRKASEKDSIEEFGKKILREFIGILFMAAGLFIFVSVVSFNPADPSFNQYLSVENQSEVKNLGGIIGAYFSDTLAQLCGSGAFLAAGSVFILAWAVIRGKGVGYFAHLTICYLFLFLSITAFIALYFPTDPFFGKEIKSGGVLGFFLYSLLTKYLNTVGSYILVSTLLFLSLMATTRLSINGIFDYIKRFVFFLMGVAQNILMAIKTVAMDLFSTGSEKLAGVVSDKKLRWQENRADKAAFNEETSINEAEETLLDEPDEFSRAVESHPKIIRGIPGAEAVESRRRENGKKKNQQEPFPFLEKINKYHIPPVSLLERPPQKDDAQDKNEAQLLLNAKILEKKLEAFGVQGKVVQVLPGPVITMYEYEPGTGVKVSKIMGLSDDLALSMRATTVRILAPVPGKAVVGIEIPNLHRETVYLREVLSSELYQNTKSRLTIAIGNDITGQPVVADLAQIPHLLIAGSTGSGKSVGVNGMISSILLKAKPDEVKFIMIDPKMLELSIYDGIPHLLSPVVTDPKKAASALRWTVQEMERRYKCLSEQGVRNISGYNKLVKDPKKKKNREEFAGDEDELLFRSLGEKDDDLKDQFKEMDTEEPEEKKVAPPTEKMPYIVVVIDELADLMMTSPKEVEFSIARIAQMARAAGIHLIVATQRPSVDVLTGLIKANFPARIAYKVASRVDSRTILDHIGAEKLLGKGDLLFCPPGTSKLERIHGCWLSDFEVKRIVEFLKNQQKPVYIKDILKQKVDDKETPEEEKTHDDPLYGQAIALVTSTGMASISMVQRKLRIGYNRAARMIEQMEMEGVVGPSDGVKQREVYAREI